MQTVTLISFAAGVALVSGGASEPPPGAVSAPPIVSQLPPQIEKAKGLLQGRWRNGIRRIMIEHFGPVQRQAGSGILTDLWDIAEGELAFNPISGPTFTPKGQHTIWLLTTHNPVRKNLLGDYEMVSLPDDASGSGRCWLGNLQIEQDLTYSYRDSGQFPEKSAQQRNTFFYLHPIGTVQVQYVTGVTDKTLLESLATGKVIAWLHFRSSDGHARQTFTITTKEPERRLVFGASAPLSFEMDKSWESFWD